MLLRGVKFPTPALNREDEEATRNRAANSGRNFGGAPLRRGGGRGGGGRGDRINYSSDRRDSNYDNRNGNGYPDPSAKSNPFFAHLDPAFVQAAAARGFPPPPQGWVPPPQFGRGAPPPPPSHGGQRHQGRPPMHDSYSPPDRRYGGQGYGGQGHRDQGYGGQGYGGQNQGGRNYGSDGRHQGGYGDNRPPRHQSYRGGGGYRGGR
ncbi:hypothetical protein EV356DRAFT_374047 [Viridothelium virens]|uniref:Uncharacterized protein n=1 Tax=Viridothelium virens TaxID=1048519 RepID=A0A6A6GV78_VIRVR|nr:hypothetical protein EV356DRAFT_374047 [Viridothelium virens]